MQREIHRMRLRYSQLQRRQEMMIADMERAIYKRDNIEAKGKVAASKKGAPPTQALFYFVNPQGASSCRSFTVSPPRRHCKNK